MADAQDYMGEQIGEYHLLRQLGRGTFGVVYLAEHVHDQTQVAIKLLRLQLTRSLELKDFLNEARVIRLRHPHIIPILDFGISPQDMPFLVMEYATGGTIRDRFWHGMSLPLPEIVTYTAQLASALQFAHSRRLIHRDVKPENILLSSDGTVLLSDFGIAKMMEQSSTMSHNAQAGTPAYMAPEQGQGEPCPASDQYALAVVVYEWLAARRPFLGTPLEVALQHRLNPPPPLRLLRPGIPREAEEVIMKALAKTPEERFETVEQFAQALQFAIDTSPTEKVHAFSQPLAAVQHQTPTTSSTVSGQSATIQRGARDSVDAGLSATMQREMRDIADIPTPQSRLTNVLAPTPLARPTLALTPIEQTPTELVEQQLDPAADPYRTVRWDGPNEASHLQDLTERAQARPADPARNRRQLIPKRRIFPVLLIIFLVCCILGCSVLLLPYFFGGVSQPQQKQSAYNLAVATAGVMFGYNAEHTSSNPYEHTLSAETISKLVLKWNMPVGNLIESSPAVANGIVYIASENGKLHAFDAVTGQQKWVATTQGSILQSSPAIANNLVYIGSGDGKLYAFNATTGAQKWVGITGNAIYASPTVANGTVYIGSSDGKLYAFDAITGQQKWTALTRRAIVSSPAVANGLVYIGSTDNNMYAFSINSGASVWMTPTKGPIEASPAVAGNTVYISSQDNKLYAFNATSGQINWTVPGGSFTFSSPAVANGVIYVGSQNSQLYAFDATSGAPVWDMPTEDTVKSSPTIANNLVYISEENGLLYAFDARSGKTEWSHRTGDAIDFSPTIANGMLYAGSQNGQLYGFALH
jgi:eukaryotic-like serine/threonine-protein kinase